MDELTRSKSRLTVWKALASEAFISLSTRDPVLSAFLTCNEIHQISNQEVHYKVKYSFCQSQSRTKGFSELFF